MQVIRKYEEKKRGREKKKLMSKSSDSSVRSEEGPRTRKHSPGTPHLAKNEIEIETSVNTITGGVSLCTCVISPLNRGCVFFLFLQKSSECEEAKSSRMQTILPRLHLTWEPVPEIRHFCPPHKSQ